MAHGVPSTVTRFTSGGQSRVRPSFARRHGLRGKEKGVAREILGSGEFAGRRRGEAAPPEFSQNSTLQTGPHQALSPRHRCNPCQTPELLPGTVSKMQVTMSKLALGHSRYLQSCCNEKNGLHHFNFPQNTLLNRYQQ